MYRKRQQELQRMEENSQVITRVSNYPVVRDTWNKVSDIYQRGKSSSTIIRVCGNVAESSASLAYKASLPVIDKLPVGVMNDYAVEKLEALEERYPVMVKPTEEVVGELRAYSTSKLDEAKTYSTNQFNKLAELARLNSVLNVADAVVDRFLPPVPQEPLPEDKPIKPSALEVEAATPASTRMRLLTDKVKRRAYENAMAKAGSIQRRSQEAVGKLKYTIDLIDYAKQNMSKLSLDDAQEKVKSVYEEITREGDADEKLPEDANLEKKAIFVARNLTMRARSTFSTVSRLAYALPSHARTAVNDAYSYTEDLYHVFSKASSFGDFGLQLISQLKEKVTFLEDVANNLTKFVFESTPLRWLASKQLDRPASPPLTADPDQDAADPGTPASAAAEEFFESTGDDTLNSTSNYDDVE